MIDFHYLLTFGQTFIIRKQIQENKVITKSTLKHLKDNILDP